MSWKPISLSGLYEHINNSESRMNNEEANLWELIKIEPVKWKEKKYGKEGGGFWVVGIICNLAVWYNDIEQGFNISRYTKYGEIDEYWCNQSELHHSINSLYQMIYCENGLIGQAGVLNHA